MQELDTSEASAPGGPFPQFDASEFSYQIVLYENDRNQPNFISSYRCDGLRKWTSQGLFSV